MLPVTFVFGRPSRAELLTISGCAVLVASTVAWARTTAQQSPSTPDVPPPQTAPIQITSEPSGASVLVDGQLLATTPASLAIDLGRHAIVVRAPDAIDESRTVDVDASGSSLDLSLWRAHPSVTYLKPPLPGAMLADAVFLEDGRLALQVVLPAGERQAWTLDPDARLASGRLGAASAQSPIAVRPDGQAVATLQPRTLNPDTDRSPLAFADHIPTAEVWLYPTAPETLPRRVWVAADPAEELVDLAWAPDNRHLIVVGHQPVAGGAARTSIRWLDTDTGEAQDLALLPSEVAPGTYVWSPDGQSVAFVVHTASLAAVCTLSVAGGFRYLGDLGHDGLAGPPVAPVAWAPDGRVLFGALVGQTPASSSNSSFPFSQNPAGLFLTDPPDAPGRSFSVTAALSPLVRADGRIFAVGLPGGQESGLRLRALTPQGEAIDVGTLDVPAPGPTAYGVRWDVDHRRALVITNRASGDGPSHDYWLLGWSTAA
jgi:PEGA domain